MSELQKASLLEAEIDEAIKKWERGLSASDPLAWWNAEGSFACAICYGVTRWRDELRQELRAGLLDAEDEDAWPSELVCAECDVCPLHEPYRACNEEWDTIRDLVFAQEPLDERFQKLASRMLEKLRGLRCPKEEAQYAE